MKALGFRQANAWLHTWVGLLLGWLLYAVFLTGTLSFFQEEITFWMKPELHASVPDNQTAQRLAQAMQSLAPNAAQWTLTLPGERNAGAQAQWFDIGQPVVKRGGQSVALDAGTAEPVTPRETRGGGFLCRFHFELYGMPRVLARWIVGIATMVMLVAIVSGVIAHKKIFKEFFTFRPRKGQRSWLDAHNATAVLALPFHLMITYSGLLLLMFMLMPWGVESAYRGDTQKFFNESGGRGARTAPAMGAGDQPLGEQVPLTDVAPLLAQAEQRWPRGVSSISVTRPGTSDAVIELRERGGDSLIDRGNSERLRFDGVSGALLNSPPAPAISTPNAIYNVFSSLHLIRFAGAPLRWFFFISGVVGTAMIATGLVLWVVKRLPERQKLGRTPIGHRLVEVLNVGTVAGLPLAIAAYFWANRLLPVDMTQRSAWEIRSFFIIWLLCLVHPLLRSHKRAWLEQLWVAAGLFAALPLFSFGLAHSHLLASLAQGQWLLAGMDLTLLASAALLGYAAWKLNRHQPLQRPQRQPRTVNTRQERAA
ncbi:PepSY-associated TM helix domain-containing protein [Pseudomonas sp. CCC4.1]|uniref:PepSY-associated TM helix domain-containing protein n=1 Tax=Pseudomonas sp. CCC4.1 TaxID=3048610 RepID=UPI002AB5B9C2|nr:PepSY-associated TM helix domain-containing protein [Pseudomonas sp. CCC4.1]MDY7572209.1 PepSY-associated TM helix domain-containing protein [Pseudomonas sp. CCC4.1]MEB0144683.1 PepSY-associated TM helix domain-containing protein [Pseudomonas sp. CCC4.1]